MKIKVKLILGIGLLFTMIVLLTGLSGLFINKLSGDTGNILADNYKSIEYGRKMLQAFNNDSLDKNEIQVFKSNLAAQQNNITEAGEQELTARLTSNFALLGKDFTNTTVMSMIREDVSSIMLLNMQAIQRKSATAKNTAANATLWIMLTGTLCFLVAFVLLVNLPGNIANPVKELSASIKQIAAQNYSQRVHFEKNNEFGELASSFNTMAEKLEEYKAGNIEKLMMEKKRIETLINNMHDPVIGLDEQKNVLFMNDTALKVTGLKIEEVMGKPVQNIAEKNDLMRSLTHDLFTAQVQGEEAKQAPVKIYANNKESYFDKEIIPIKIIPTGEKHEKLVGNVILLQNITPYKELDFAKTNFIATVSHELKTPLSSIKMSLQLLDNRQVGELNEEQKKLVEGIKEDADRLLKLTGELLNMTQVESGSIQMAVLRVSPAEIIERAVNTNKLGADKKKIKLRVSIAENIPDVLADKDKTVWVLTNLISNAIRYSYENSKIFIDLVQDAERVKFSVTDTGQGIAPQYIDKIFDRYFRIPGTQKEGTGLGLSISKELIEAQGGTLSVKSDFGAGSTFIFMLNKA
ncbi:MAG: ATP-binding protein [Ferruginibacter sp.]